MEVTVKRLFYLEKLDEIIARALEKYRNYYTKNSERIRWGRLAANTIKTAVDVLTASEIKDIVKRLEKLEENVYT